MRHQDIFIYFARTLIKLGAIKDMTYRDAYYFADKYYRGEATQTDSKL